jgi:hypothetical protein
MRSFLLSCLALSLFACLPEAPRPEIPVLVGEPWRLCQAPDLDSLNGPDLSRQHVVDHGFIQAEDGSWQLWACMRGTKVGRLLYRWEGSSLTEGPWEPQGIAMRADASFGEKAAPQEAMQAPFFLKKDSLYLCFYNSAGIRLLTSADGKRYQRGWPGDPSSNLLYEEGGRDVMVVEHEGQYLAYSTISTVAKDNWKYGFVILRSSPDLKRWSDYSIVSAGGRAGAGVVSAESPFVLKKGEFFYLFRASSITGTTFVYASRDPYHFGIHHDEKLIAELPVKAPELIEQDGQWYLSDLGDFQGVMLHRIRWE